MERGRQTDCMDAGAAGSGLCPRRHPQPPTRTLGPDMFPPARGEPTPTASTAELTGPVGAHSRSQTVAEIEKNMTPEYRSQKERMHQRQEARLRRDSPLGSRRGCRRLAELAAKQAGAERSDALRLTPTDGESAAQGSGRNPKGCVAGWCCHPCIPGCRYVGSTTKPMTAKVAACG